MKNIIIVLFLLFCFTSFAQQSIGGKNYTIIVKGGLAVDSALELPIWDTTMNFTSKGVDSFGVLVINKYDSFPTICKNGIWYKILTKKDSSYFITPAQKGIAKGVASLDSNGKVPANQISLSYGDSVYVDSNVTKMLSHSNAPVGSTSIRTDSNVQFKLRSLPSNNYSNWVKIPTSANVLSFNSRVGAVIGRKNDYITDSISEGSTNLYFTSSRVQTVIATDTTALVLATVYYVDTYSYKFLKIKDSNIKYVTLTQLNDTVANKPNGTITLTGAITGTGTNSIATTLSNSGVGGGTYNHIAINSKGIATHGDSISYLINNQPDTIYGDATGTGIRKILLTLDSVNPDTGYYGNATNSASILLNKKGQVIAAVNSPIQFPVTLAILADSTTKKPNYTDSTILYATPTQLADTGLKKIKYSDSNTVYITPIQLLDTVNKKVSYKDSNTVYITPIQLLDTVNKKVSYKDSTTKYVTPNQLIDSFVSFFGSGAIIFDTGTKTLPVTKYSITYAINYNTQNDTLTLPSIGKGQLYSVINTGTSTSYVTVIGSGTINTNRYISLASNHAMTFLFYNATNYYIISQY